MACSSALLWHSLDSVAGDVVNIPFLSDVCQQLF